LSTEHRGIRPLHGLLSTKAQVQKTEHVDEESSPISGRQTNLFPLLESDFPVQGTHPGPELAVGLRQSELRVKDACNAEETKKQDADNQESTAHSLMMARLTVLGVAAMYGTNFGSVKILQESMPPSLAAGLRFSLAGLALLPMLKNMRKEAIAPSVEIGLLVAAGYFAQGLGLETADASTAAFLCSLAVVVCPLLDVFENKKLGANAWVSAALAVAGAGVLELGGVKGPCAGDLWALAQPVMFGTAFWKTEQAMHKFPDQTGPLTAVQILVVAACSMLWALADGGGSIDMGLVANSLADVKIAAALVWTGLFTTALTVMLETWALARLSSAETTVLFSTEPLWGTAFAYAALGEHVGANAFVGGALILAACGCSFSAAAAAESEGESVSATAVERKTLAKREEEKGRKSRKEELMGFAHHAQSLRFGVAGACSWVGMQLKPIQGLLSDLTDLV